jgi:hypothetical protein
VPRRCEGARLKPYLVLGHFVPTVWDAQRIARSLCWITHKAGLTPHVDPAHGPLTKVPWYSVPLHAEVRRRSFRTKMAEGWHYDGDTTLGSRPDCAIVLWASNNPTEIRRRIDPCVESPGWTADGATSVYQPKPYEVVIFRNLRCLHRRPEGVPLIRWVFRQRVAVPQHLELP